MLQTFLFSVFIIAPRVQVAASSTFASPANRVTSRALVLDAYSPSTTHSFSAESHTTSQNSTHARCLTRRALVS